MSASSSVTMQNRRAAGPWCHLIVLLHPAENAEDITFVSTGKKMICAFVMTIYMKSKPLLINKGLVPFKRGT